MRELPKPKPDSTPVPDYLRLARVDGRTFVVLGGGNGIGRQTCHALAQSGAQVVCVDRDTDAAHRVAAEIGGLPFEADVTRRSDVEALIEFTARKHGGVHGLVDIVGMPHLGPLANLNDGAWRSQFDLVLTHAFLAIQIGGAAIARSGGGAITCVASMSGMVKIPGQVAYGTAKAALIQLVAGMGAELGPQRVRVNAVAPGFVRTPRLDMMLSEAQWHEIGRLIPIGRAAFPLEIASTILFLSSDLAAHVTGQTLLVDGGVAGVVQMPKLSITGD
jgi:NAD(P)-dependent dehydrogenase (short-subunit alcohol dehydrogenase family)